LNLNYKHQYDKTIFLQLGTAPHPALWNQIDAFKLKHHKAFETPHLIFKSTTSKISKRL